MSLRTYFHLGTLPLVLCILALGFTRVALAQSGHVLTDEERSNALEIESTKWSPEGFVDRPPAESFARSLAGTPKARDRISLVVAVTSVGMESTASRVREALKDGPASGRRALVTRYEYATGLTIRTWINLSTRKVLLVRRDANFPAPLAPEELEQAKQLLQKFDSEIKDVVRTRPDDVEFVHMVPANRKWLPSRAGHRIVLLWLASPVQSRRYLIDLSREEVLESP